MGLRRLVFYVVFSVSWFRVSSGVPIIWRKMLTEAYGHTGKQPASIIYLTRALVRVLRQGLVIWAGFKLAILLLQFPECWDYMCVPPRLDSICSLPLIPYHIISYHMWFSFHIYLYLPYFREPRKNTHTHTHIYLVMHVNTYQYYYIFDKEERKSKTIM